MEKKKQQSEEYTKRVGRHEKKLISILMVVLSISVMKR
jgi:hypothetical protein